MVNAALTRHRRNKAMALPKADMTAPTASASLEFSSKKGVSTWDSSMWKHPTKLLKCRIRN